jgi:hypothetical protein
MLELKQKFLDVYIQRMTDNLQIGLHEKFSSEGSSVVSGKDGERGREGEREIERKRSGT